MEDRLSKEELFFIEEGIRFYKTTGAKILKGGLLISIIFPLLVFLMGRLAFIGMMILMGVLTLITSYMWYWVFGQPNSQLKKDFGKGIKITETLTVNKIKNSKEGKIYRMSNGLKIKESDFNDDNSRLGELGQGQILIVTYTPYHRMILNIKEIKLYGT